MISNRILGAALATVASLALASCGSSSSDAPGSGETSSISDASGPFAIPKPLNLAGVADPCDLLTEKQIKQLGGAKPTPHGKSPWGQSQCQWSGNNFDVSIAPDTVQKQGIKYPAFTNTDSGKPTHHVKSYPAVYSGKNDVRCSTFVGTSKMDVFVVHYTVGTAGRDNPKYSDPCAMSDKIAGMVLQNLPTE